MMQALKIFGYLVAIGAMLGGLYIGISYQAYLGVNIFQ